jgi:hypothetical protein
VPGGELAGIEYEALPILGFALAAGALVCVPFLDRGQGLGRVSLFTVPGVLAALYVVGSTAWGYRSWVPVGVVAGAAGLLAAMGLATRPPGRSARE